MIASVTVVLAAGAGRRLGGVNKALLRTRTGATYLEAIAATARAAGSSHLVVVTGAPHHAEVGPAAEVLGAVVAINPAPDRGMASSVAVGFGCAAASFDRCQVALLWPVDHPAVAVDTVARLLASPAMISVPTFAGRGGHPAAFRRAVWPELIACEERGDGARAVVRADPGRVARLEVDDAGVVRDVDHPGDLASGAGRP
ncbi:MAG TPA: nucleotidyltransferase family protein [Kofleriaceae bacterium]|nr:nucleotidyltransferase family protein [Kofleriaceae bacterium]